VASGDCEGLKLEKYMKLTYDSLEAGEIYGV